MWKGFLRGWRRVQGTYSASERFYSLAESIMTRYLATGAQSFSEEEVEAMVTGRSADMIAKPKTVLVSAEGMPAASLFAQALRQGEEAADNRLAAARTVGTEY